MITLHNEDNIVTTSRIDDNTIDAVITDPPYGIAFMNKKWDYDVPQTNTWKEVYRILKPGAHILVACGTRTYHRMVTNIEDAGFNIRDCIVWAYGSGFPKSLNISKDIDRQLGCKREVMGIKQHAKDDFSNNLYAQDPANKNNTRVFGYGEEIITAPSSPQAITYDGYGTALKPAIELWCLAMKPISEKNIAQNVLKWGTGGINVDGCRIGTEERTFIKVSYQGKTGEFSGQGHNTLNGMKLITGNTTVTGRFPANLIHDGSEEVLGLFPTTKSTPKKSDKSTPNNTTRENCIQFSQLKHQFNYGQENNTSAARFFYVPKASKTERNTGLGQSPEVEMPYGSGGGGMPNGNNNPKKTKQQNFHPTVKPIALMQYLIRLISPPNNPIVYDPFMGSGSTGVAAILENVNFIGSELNPDYFNIAQQRINHHNNTHKQQNLL